MEEEGGGGGERNKAKKSPWQPPDSHANEKQSKQDVTAFWQSYYECKIIHICSKGAAI